MIVNISLVAKKPYQLGNATGITYGGYVEVPVDGKRYIMFTSPDSNEYEIYPDVQKLKKFDPKQCEEIEIFEWFDMFSGKVKFKDIPPRV